MPKRWGDELLQGRARDPRGRALRGISAAVPFPMLPKCRKRGISGPRPARARTTAQRTESSHSAIPQLMTQLRRFPRFEKPRSTLIVRLARFRHPKLPPIRIGQGIWQEAAPIFDRRRCNMRRRNGARHWRWYGPFERRRPRAWLLTVAGVTSV